RTASRPASDAMPGPYLAELYGGRRHAYLSPDCRFARRRAANGGIAVRAGGLGPRPGYALQTAAARRSGPLRAASAWLAGSAAASRPSSVTAISSLPLPGSRWLWARPARAVPLRSSPADRLVPSPGSPGQRAWRVVQFGALLSGLAFVQPSARVPADPAAPAVPGRLSGAPQPAPARHLSAAARQSAAAALITPPRPGCRK